MASEIKELLSTFTIHCKIKKARFLWIPGLLFISEIRLTVQELFSSTDYGKYVLAYLGFILLLVLSALSTPTFTNNKMQLLSVGVVLAEIMQLFAGSIGLVIKIPKNYLGFVKIKSFQLILIEHHLCITSALFRQSRCPKRLQPTPVLNAGVKTAE